MQEKLPFLFLSNQLTADIEAMCFWIGMKSHLNYYCSPLVRIIGECAISEFSEKIFINTTTTKIHKYIKINSCQEMLHVVLYINMRGFNSGLLHYVMG